ncbi:ExsB protein [Legionella birminghamensis]|uniref:7-cyano-7-deazaguanine synthase n=1 Tax=Legionella birminghamensis TaxID=28083 RepID=A0A378IMA5_9GAMM|nr:7-cyano-7-deazaguanine synthase QueC [Legionella birminghamensis]KTC68834.1 ExsB protein [Legionella birminghamensis]STX33224.1 ExsB protein [Legionella birminghamensis]
MKNAVVLLSGGLDSTTCLAIAKAAGYQCHALSFSYGQRHNSEIEAARRVAAFFDVAEHRIVNLDINQFGGSALTDETISVPDYQPSQSIPVTYVPARNTIFLSIALGYAEVIGASDIFIGISSVDYSNYPDCRPDYMDAFKKMAALATRAGVEGKPLEIHTPLVSLSKCETIKLGASLGADYALTISCYQADSQGKACGRCDSCTFRRKGFIEAGLSDPTIYQ